MIDIENQIPLLRLHIKMGYSHFNFCSSTLQILHTYQDHTQFCQECFLTLCHMQNMASFFGPQPKFFKQHQARKKGKTFALTKSANCVDPSYTFHKTQQRGMGKREQHFGKDCYNNNHSTKCAKWLARSLEMKWGIIKHDLSKFAGCYGVVQGLCEFGISVDNILQKVLKFFKNKQPQKLSFTFFYIVGQFLRMDFIEVMHVIK